MGLHTCPKCGQNTFETWKFVCFGSDPHHEGYCTNPECNAIGRMDILGMKAEIANLREQLKERKKDD